MVQLVDLVVPMKSPPAAKSRLRGALDCAPDDQAHVALVLAIAGDTLTAAIATSRVRKVLVVSADPGALAGLALPGGIDITGENGETGLNAAVRHGEALLRADDPDAVVAAMHADLPALRPSELDAALAEAAGRRAFVADRHGTGTTLLISAPGMPLSPRFGEGSAAKHAASGAAALEVAAESLRGDVDTAGDLAHARGLGLGHRTAALLGGRQVRLAPCVR